MSRLLDLLRATAGEAALSSGLGRWRQAVSEAVAAIQSGTFDTLDVLGNLNFWTAQNGGWRDMIGTPVSHGAGTNPTWTQIAATPFFGYKYQLNDELQFNYHLQHDYAPGSPIFLHAHWLTDGTNVNPVKWEWTYTFARGFNQANYNLAGTVVTAEEAGPNTVYRHMTTEIAVGINDASFQPDGILMVRVRRVTNGATDNADGVFLMTADCHYQANAVATKWRQPPFYTGAGP